MKDSTCVAFLQAVLPRLRMRWPGFRKVRRQVCKRIDRRLHELGLADVEAYRAYLDAHADEWAVLDEYCRIPISRFYRDRGVFDFLRDRVLPDLAAANEGGTLWCWSAGCASGEEPYTLALVWRLCLAERFPNTALHVVATDVQPGMLRRAQAACYSASSLKDLPRDWLPAAFDRTDDLYRLKPEFRADVELRQQDLRREMPQEQFSLILCRHLAFTYFDGELQRRTLERLVDRLAPGGVFVAGKQEPLPRLPARLVELGRQLGVYQLRCASHEA